MSFMDLLTVIEDYPATVAGVVAIVAVITSHIICIHIEITVVV